MYCHQCGAENFDHARFCSMCGTRMARPDGEEANASREPSSVAASAELDVQAAQSTSDGTNPSADSQLSSTMELTLQSVGIQSSAKGRMMLALGAIVLLLIGAGISWSMTKKTPEQGGAQPEDDFVIGTPMPIGEDTPGVDYVSGVPKRGETSKHSDAKKNTNKTKTRRKTNNAKKKTDTGKTSTPTTETGHASKPNGDTGSGHKLPAPHSEDKGNNGSTNDDSDDTANVAENGTNDGTGSNTDNSDSANNSADNNGGSTKIPSEVEDEKDLELELYGARVRHSIKRYYAGRARACFERATKNNPALHGQVVVSLTIVANGNVGGAKSTKNSTGDKNLAICLENQIKKWRFPAPPKPPVHMQLPFSR